MVKMLKSGGLFQVARITFAVWSTSDFDDFRRASTLEAGDFFILLKPNSLFGFHVNYSEILISKDGKRGFIANLAPNIQNGFVVEVKELEQ